MTPPSQPMEAIKIDLPRPLRESAPVILGLALGLAGTHLVLTLDWLVVVAAIVAIPVVYLLVKYPFYGLLAWLLLAPFLIDTNSAAQRGLYWIIHRALPPMSVILIAYWMRSRGPLFRLGLPEAAMGGYLAVTVCSILLFNATPAATTIHLYDRVFAPMCVYLAVRLWRPAEEDAKRLIPIVLFIAVSQSVIGMLSWVAPHILPKPWLIHQGLRTTGSLGDPSTYGQALIFSGAILLHRAAGTAKPSLRLLFFGVSMMAFFCVFFSFSRSTWLAGLLAFGGLAYLYPRRILPFSLFAVLASAVVGIVFFSEQIEFAGRRLYSQGSERAAVTRFPVYLAGMRMFLEKPIVGWGYANFDRYDREFQGRIEGVFDDNKDHASHNFYLTILSEQGLVGFCLFLFPAIWWMVVSVKERLRVGLNGFQNRNLLLIVWLSVIGHLLLINFHNIRNPFAWGLWWLALGWIAAMVDFRRGNSRGFAFAAAPPTSAGGVLRGAS